MDKEELQTQLQEDIITLEEYEIVNAVEILLYMAKFHTN